MKTRFVLTYEGLCDEVRIVGIFKTEKAAWAHLDFLGEKKHSEIHLYDVQEVESFE